MRVAWLFGGQGCETPGMGLHLPDAVLQPLLERVSEQIGRDARRVLESGGPGWGRTEIMQPLLVAVGLATAAVLPGTAQVFAGHSLGELTAWAAAGGCSALDAVGLAAGRGRSMSGVEGGMVVADEPPDGLSLAVINPGERVYSGPLAAVRGAVANGARRVPVSGPWHGAALEGASRLLADALSALPVLETPSFMGSLPELRPREQLAQSLRAPFLWEGVLQRLCCEHVVLCGPAKPLRTHLRRALPNVTVWRTDSPSALEHTLQFMENMHAT